MIPIGLRDLRGRDSAATCSGFSKAIANTNCESEGIAADKLAVACGGCLFVDIERELLSWAERAIKGDRSRGVAGDVRCTQAHFLQAVETFLNDGARKAAAAKIAVRANTFDVCFAVVRVDQRLTARHKTAVGGHDA